MQALRVCIGSNDGRHIAETHMGDTDFFVIYDICPGSESSFVEQRKNVAKELDHAKSDKMKIILDLLDDTQILVAQQRSPNFVKIATQTQYQPVIVKYEEILDVLVTLSGEYEKLWHLVERRQQGEHFEIIPELGGPLQQGED